MGQGVVWGPPAAGLETVSVWSGELGVQGLPLTRGHRESLDGDIAEGIKDGYRGDSPWMMVFPVFMSPFI